MSLMDAYKELVLDRRSVKRYDPEFKIPKEELTRLLEDALRAPSAINLQPWRFLILESEGAREKMLRLAPHNQDQVKTASHLILIFADQEFAGYGKEIFDQTVDEGKMPRNVADFLINMVDEFKSQLPQQEKEIKMALDTGLFCQQLMITARAYGYDTCPIAGYDQSRAAEVFGWDKERYLPLLLVSIGKAKDPGNPSSRLPLERVSEWR